MKQRIGKKYANHALFDGHWADPGSIAGK